MRVEILKVGMDKHGYSVSQVYPKLFQRVMTSTCNGFNRTKPTAKVWQAFVYSLLTEHWLLLVLKEDCSLDGCLETSVRCGMWGSVCVAGCEGRCVELNVKLVCGGGDAEEFWVFPLERGKNLELLIFCLYLPSSGMIGRRHFTLLLRFSSLIPSSKLHSALTSASQLLDSWTLFNIYFLFPLGTAVPDQQANSRGETFPLATWALQTESFHFLCLLFIAQTQRQAGQWAEHGSLICLNGNSLSLCKITLHCYSKPRWFHVKSSGLSFEI